MDSNLSIFLVGSHFSLFDKKGFLKDLMTSLSRILLLVVSARADYAHATHDEAFVVTAHIAFSNERPEKKTSHDEPPCMRETP